MNDKLLLENIHMVYHISSLVYQAMVCNLSDPEHKRTDSINLSRDNLADSFNQNYIPGISFKIL